MPHEDYCYALERETEDLRKQLAALKSELKTIGEAINDPRTDLTMTMSEVIIEFKQQLAAALAACKAKDELIRMCAGIQVGYLKDALAIQPDDSALKAWLGEPVMYLDKDGCTILPEDMEGNPRAHWQSLYAPKGMK